MVKTTVFQRLFIGTLVVIAQVAHATTSTGAETGVAEDLFPSSSSGDKDSPTMMTHHRQKRQYNYNDNEDSYEYELDSRDDDGYYYPREPSIQCFQCSPCVGDNWKEITCNRKCTVELNHANKTISRDCNLGGPVLYLETGCFQSKSKPLTGYCACETNLCNHGLRAGKPTFGNGGGGGDDLSREYDDYY